MHLGVVKRISLEKLAIVAKQHETATTDPLMPKKHSRNDNNGAVKVLAIKI